MAQDYHVGIDSNPIYLEIKVGTEGIAVTSVYWKDNGGSKKKIANSNAGSGNIPKSSIGTAVNLKGTLLDISTIVDFSHLDSSFWDQLKDNLSIVYELDGGPGGKTKYEYNANKKVRSNGKKVISITQIINLIA